MQNLIKHHDVFGQLTVVVEGSKPFFIVKEVSNILDCYDYFSIFDSIPKYEKRIININIMGSIKGINCLSKEGVFSFIKISGKVLPGFHEWIEKVSTKDFFIEIKATLINSLSDNNFLIKVLDLLKKEEGIIKKDRKSIVLNYYCSSEIASELKFNSVHEFNRALEIKKFHYKDKGMWIPHIQYRNQNFCYYKNRKRLWSRKGREFLINLLKG